MIAVVSVCEKDVDHAIKLAQWITKLGGCKAFDVLLVADAATPFDQTMELAKALGESFQQVIVRATARHVPNWPDGPNANWSACARLCKEMNRPWLFLEPDVVPMRAGWLAEIAEAYNRIGAKYLGHIYPCSQPFLPSRFMSGVACYPALAIDEIAPLPNTPRAWEVDAAERMIASGAHTDKIYHFFGQPNLPPTFVARKDAHSPVNAMTLENIPAEAVLYHRCKNDSLIRLLERKLFPNEFREKICVAFNVYAGDLNLALHHSVWLRKLAGDRRWPYRALICHDPSCPVVGLNHLEANLRQCFEVVDTLVYPRPGIPTYPACANWAFQNVALHMTNGKSPWFWCESDLVVLRADWLDQLQAEYDGCSRSWMGPVVAHMFHLQGTSIYPADAAARMPRAMRAVDQAFDMEMKEETLHDRHDCGHLIHHVWSILNGQMCPVGGGEIPANATPELLSQIPKTCVATHRWKDNSVIDLLMSGAYKH